MLIHVKLSASLRDYVKGYDPQTGLDLEVETGRTAAHIIGRLGMPMEMIKIIMVNGTHANADQTLHHGDRLSLFPAVGGG